MCPSAVHVSGKADVELILWNLNAKLVMFGHPALWNWAQVMANNYVKECGGFRLQLAPYFADVFGCRWCWR